jgi:hypothetical protein
MYVCLWLQYVRYRTHELFIPTPPGGDMWGGGWVASLAVQGRADQAFLASLGVCKNASSGMAARVSHIMA